MVKTDRPENQKKSTVSTELTFAPFNKTLQLCGVALLGKKKKLCVAQTP